MDFYNSVLKLWENFLRIRKFLIFYSNLQKLEEKKKKDKLNKDPMPVPN